MHNILRVNMNTLELAVAPVPERWFHLGGRALTSTVVAEEVDPLAEPLGPKNKLVFAPGLLSGTTMSSSNRLSIGCKSPLTGGIKEANAGGETGMRLAQAGLRAVIVEGAADDWQLLVIDNEGAHFEPAGDLVGMPNRAAADRLRERFAAPKLSFSLCGPAGEMLMNIAGIEHNDVQGRPSRIAARGGVGAVMGSKKLKAIVVLPDVKVPIMMDDADLWKDAFKAYHKALLANPSTADRYPKYGTAATLEVVNKFGGLPTKNFSRGQYEHADDISGVKMREVILERGGDGLPTHACMTGCVIRCSNVFADKNGKEVVSSMEYETNSLCGSNLEIHDFDEIAAITHVCDELGVDTIETGAALGVCFEAGLGRWGQVDDALKLLDEVAKGTPLGRIVGSGAGLAGKVLGVRRVPVVKNQAMAAYDPRAIKGNGVTYSMSPMGADHTVGNTIGVKTDHLDPKDKVAISRDMQIICTLLDTFGFCNFARGPVQADHDYVVNSVNARFGTDLTWGGLETLGLEILRLEQAFNRKAGLGPETDRLPEWMLAEPLPPFNAVFDVSYDEIEHMYDADVVEVAGDD